MSKFIETSLDNIGCVTLNNYSIADSQHIQGLKLCMTSSYSETYFFFPV